ncbi:hypothetical protein BHM03_00062859, partial [Ensete ventricosum]
GGCTLLLCWVSSSSFAIRTETPSSALRVVSWADGRPDSRPCRAGARRRGRWELLGTNSGVGRVGVFNLQRPSSGLERRAEDSHGERSRKQLHRQRREVVSCRRDSRGHRRHQGNRVRTTKSLAAAGVSRSVIGHRHELSSVVRLPSRHAIVEELARFGAAIHTCSRNEAELNKCLKEWGAKNFKVTGSVCDVSSQAAREKLMEDVKSTFGGKLSILVSNKKDLHARDRAACELVVLVV